MLDVITITGKGLSAEVPFTRYCVVNECTILYHMLVDNTKPRLSSVLEGTD